MSRFDIRNIIRNLRGVIIISLISILFIGVVEFNIDIESKRSVEEVNKQIAEKVNLDIKYNIEKLNFIEGYINRSKNLYSSNYNETRVIEVINSILKGNLFERISIIDKDGESNTGDKKYDVKDRSYFKEAIKGKTYISEPMKSRYNNEDIIVYSKPIKEDGKIIGVLEGSSNYENVKNALISNAFSDKSEISIINAEGKIIIGNSKEGENIFDSYKDIKKIEILKSKMKNSNMDYGIDTFKKGKEKNYVAYNKLDCNQNWYLVSSTPINDVFKNAHIVASISKIIIVLFMIIYVTNDVKKYKLNKIKLDKASYIDLITNISNKIKLKLDFEEMNKYKWNIKDKKRLMIIFDVCGLKSINENFGYEEGDSILKKVATKLKKIVNTNIYGRMSNDIFSSIIECDIDTSLDEVVREFKKNIEYDVLIPDNTKINIDIGACTIEENMIFEKAVDNANLARLESKKNNTIEYYIYDEKLAFKKDKENTIKKELKNGLEKGEFKLVYQPKVDVKTEKIVGAEALIRWIHTEKGFISPVEFIPIAEKNGDINLIGKWVLERVCKYINESVENGDNVVPISINISRVELYQSDLIDFISKTIKKYNINPSLLEFEITETAALNDVEYINNRIQEIKSLGIKVSMDDFGTGSSTLSNLKRIDIDILKIDRSILLDLEYDLKSRDLVSNIIDIGKKFGFIVVCEGVENMEQVEILKSFNCDIIQGFVFSKPLELDEFKKMIKNTKN